jgi:hypothetical protein
MRTIANEIAASLKALGEARDLTALVPKRCRNVSTPPALYPACVETPEWLFYSSQMKKATLTETKNNLSALVDQVQHGETILILDRGGRWPAWSPCWGKGTIPKGGLPAWSVRGFCAGARYRYPVRS